MTGKDLAADTTHPEFAPERALGWRDIGLDGLGCFLRSMEAVLLHRGFTATQVAWGLVAPLDLVRRTDWAGPYSTFPGCTVEWVFGETAWPRLMHLLGQGEPAIIMPDSWGWPGDDFRHRHHYRHHMVLATAHDGEHLHLLDTDAPREAGYRRSLAVSTELRAACDGIGVVRSGPPPEAPSPAALHQLVAASVQPLAEDIAEISAFANDRWGGRPLHPLLARGLDVLVLGDIQPQLFLLAHALAEGATPQLESVAAASAVAAKRAQKLGLLLLGLHRFNSPGVYELVQEEFLALADALRTLLEAMGGATGPGDPAGTEGEPGARFVARLRALTAWCFGEGGEAPAL